MKRKERKEGMEIGNSFLSIPSILSPTELFGGLAFLPILIVWLIIARNPWCLKNALWLIMLYKALSLFHSQYNSTSVCNLFQVEIYPPWRQVFVEARCPNPVAADYISDC
jgi:hypothetical protein